MKNSIPFGYNPEKDKLLDSAQVKKGIACGCICPECNAPLEAVHGKVRKWHFRHAKSSGTNKRICIHPLESSIHAKAKELFKERAVFYLPNMTFTAGNQVSEIFFREAEDFIITKIETEYRKDGSEVIPDIALFSGERKVYVEILVTHAVGDSKIEKLHERGIPTLEINLGKDIDMLETLTEAEFKDLLFNRDDNREWVYCEERYQLQKKLMLADRLRYLYPLSNAKYQVRDCPFNPEQNYNSIEDCGSCKYCISIDPDNDDNPRGSGTIVCSARAGFSLKDAALTVETINSEIVRVQAVRKDNIRRHKEEEARRYAAFEREQREAEELRRKKAEAAALAKKKEEEAAASEAKRIIVPKPEPIYKCVKCGKEGPRKRFFKAMRSSEQKPVCDECVLTENCDYIDKGKIFYCPKCGVMLHKIDGQSKCGSISCGWSIPLY